MNNLPHLVTSLELSKRLEELGCKQDSVFQWRKNTLGEPYIIQTPPKVLDEMRLSGTLEYAISAYTAGELGEMDFMKRFNGEKSCHSEYNYVYKKWTCYAFDENVETFHQEDGSTEADARAKMLIFLLTSNLIKVTK